MPLYTYDCHCCWEVILRTEKVENRRRAEDHPCPKCKARGSVLKRLDAPAFSFKGGSPTQNAVQNDAGRHPPVDESLDSVS